MCCSLSASVTSIAETSGNMLGSGSVRLTGVSTYGLLDIASALLCFLPRL